MRSWLHSTFLSSLRTRLVLLVLLAVVPALGLILYTASEQRRAATAEAEENTLRLVRLAANNQRQIFEGTRQLLTILAQIPIIRKSNLPECDQLLADLLTQQPIYTNFTVLDTQGKRLCSAIPYSASVNAADRAYFQRALQTRKFAVGDYQIGRVSKKATVNFAYPVLNNAGQVQSVITAALDLTQLNQLAAQVKLPEGSVLSVVDHKGILLVRYPYPQNWVGKSLPKNAFTRMKDAYGEGVYEVKSLDGMQRIFGFVPLGDDPLNPDAYIRVGTPLSTVFAKANWLLARNLIGLGTVTILALIAAWIGGDIFLVAQIKSLVRTAQQLGKGELNTRSKIDYKSGEIGQLARAIDEMVEALETREMAIASLDKDLKTLFELVPIGILIAQDPKFTQVKANPAFAKILGISSEANISYTPVDAPPPSYKLLRDGKELAPEEFPLRYAAIHKTEVKGTEVDIVRGDNTVFNLFGYAAPLLDEQGNVRGSVAAFLDITERKQAEAHTRELLSQIQNQANVLQTILSASVDHIYIFDRAGRYQYVSRGGATVMGLQPEDFVGKTWQELNFSPELVETMHQLDAHRTAVMATGQPMTVEAKYTTSNQIYYYEYILAPLQTSTQTIKGVIAVSRDITERKQTEEILRTSEERFQAFMAHSPASAWITDAAGQIIYLSPTYFRTFQLPTGSLIGKTVFELYDAEIAEQFLENIRTVAKTNQVVETIEVAPRPNGTMGDFLVYKFPIANLSGQPLIGGVAIDITERRRVEEEREELLLREQAARETAETANRIKDEFLAVLSHELRTPLNPILGWTSLLRNGKLNEHQKAIALETIERNAKLQTQLIGDLLDISRILQGKLTLNITPVNLAATIAAAKETVRLAAEAKSIEIHTEFAPGVKPFMGDSSRLQQVVWNLLTNAVKFTPVGGQVNVKLETVGSYAQIQVIDTGKGIDAEFLPYVFDTFRQADSATTRKFGGLGLGLAIVRHIVEMHGGTVFADSGGEGQGATFTVELPLMISTPEVNENATQPEKTLDLSGLRILVVDDEQDTRELMVFIIQQSGANVTAVASASEALEVLKQSQPDVLVSDIAMPEINGYMLIRQVRTWSPEQGGQIPAIALTAYAGEINEQQALLAGFQKHLSKPVEPDELVQAIANLAY
jgi:PAS domain S-box-containing protein